MESLRGERASRGLARDAGLGRSAAWTRRITAAAVASCAVMMAGFAHVLPSLDLHGGSAGSSTSGSSGTSGTSGTSGSSGTSGTSGGSGTSGTSGSSGSGAVQAPGAGSGFGQVVSGAS